MGRAEDCQDTDERAITIIFIVVVSFLGGLLVGLGIAASRSSWPLEPAAPAIDYQAINGLAACLEDEATEACHLEPTREGFDVIGRQKGE